MTITANGKIHIADQMGLRTQIPIMYLAIGTGSPTATELGAELKVRGATVTRTDNVVTYKANWGIDDEFSATITEAGLFYPTAGGGKTMVASGVCGKVKAFNDPLNVSWTLTFS